MKEFTRLNETHYDEIFALSQFAFQYELTEEEVTKKNPKLVDITYGD